VEAAREVPRRALVEYSALVEPLGEFHAIAP